MPDCGPSPVPPSWQLPTGLVLAWSLATWLLGCPSDDPHGLDPHAPVGDGEPRAGGPASDGLDNPASPPSMSPPGSSGGQSGEGGDPPDTCTAERWSGLEADRVVARCNRSSPETYRCTCHTGLCSAEGSVTVDDPDADGGAESAGCRFDIAAEACSEALEAGCGLADPQNGFCEAYSVAGFERCFARDGGGFVCYCPSSDSPLLQDDLDCRAALAHACVAK